MSIHTILFEFKIKIDFSNSSWKTVEKQTHNKFMMRRSTIKVICFPGHLQYTFHKTGSHEVHY